MILYRDYETQISQDHLTAVFSQMREPVCLLGGWAVYLTVNKRFNDIHGRNYLGSRDIDLGFHINSNWSMEELKNLHWPSLPIFWKKEGLAELAPDL